MNNFKLLYLFVFYFISYGLPAQSIFPLATDQPFWEAKSFGFDGPRVTYWSVGQAVDACGGEWVPIFEQWEANTIPRGYYQLDGPRVYYRETLDDCNEAAGILMDFSVSVGDTVEVYQDLNFEGGQNQVYQVMAEGVANYGGVWRRYLTVGIPINHDDPGAHWYLTRWVEGLGDIYHPFPTLADISLNDNLTESWQTSLCLRVNEEEVIYTSDPENCAYELSRIYVDKDVRQGTWTDGSSWEQAFADLQDALAIADYGDRIWIAEGMYYPTNENDRNASFQLVNGVKIFGGFAGTEIHLNERDWTFHQTILSGELGDTSTTEDNSYHVVRGQALDATTLLDGLVVERGRANAPFSMYNERLGAGLFLYADELDSLCVPLLRNCHFRENEAEELGGAVYAHRHSSRAYQADPRFEGCTFSHNTAFSGSAVHKSGSTPGYATYFKTCTFQANESQEGALLQLEHLTDSLLFWKCRFVDNQSLAGSSGISLFPRGRQVSVFLQNTVFDGNTGALGGALFMDSPSDGVATRVDFVLDSCQFRNNTARTSSGGAIFLSSTQDTIQLKVKACRFMHNRSNVSRGGAIFIEKLRSSVTWMELSNSEFYGNEGAIAGGGVVFVEPRPFESEPAQFQGRITNCIFSENKGITHMGNTGRTKTTLEVINSTTVNNGAYIFTKAADTTLATTYLANNFFYEYDAGTARIFYNGIPDRNEIWGYKLQNNVMPGRLLHTPDRIAADLGGNRALGSILYPPEHYFTDPENYDFSLAPCSPGINAGSNEVAAAYGLGDDITGNSRILDEIVDMGAVEGGIEAFVPHFSVTHTSSATAFDGEIVLDSISSSEMRNYEVEWERNGSTEWTLSGLRFGSYVVHIRDDQGCQLRFVVNVSVATATSDLAGEEIRWSLFPNPVATHGKLQLESAIPVEWISVHNAVGQGLWSGTVVDLANLYLDKLGGSGLYLVQVRFEDGRLGVRKLVVE